MKQHGVSEEEVIEVFNKQVVDYWKDINEEFLRPTAVPMPVLLRVLNLTKVVDLLLQRRRWLHTCWKSYERMCCYTFY